MNHFFIIEQTEIVYPDEIKIISESVLESGRTSVSALTRLQRDNVINSNRRVYETTVCESIVGQLAPRAKANSLLQEIDHPMFFPGSDNPEKMKQRAATVMLDNCCSKLTNIYFKNGEILGEFHTLSGFKGPDFADLITKDKVNIGFSLRALGGVEPLQDGTLKVKLPILPITYDVVSNPSHQDARIIEFLPESDFSMLEQSEILMYEGTEVPLLEQDNISFGNLSTGNFAKGYLDSILESKFKAVSKKILFNF